MSTFFLLGINLLIFFFKKHFKSQQDGQSINIVPIMFNQGVNEEQTVANDHGQHAKQDELNTASMAQLKNYSLKYRSILWEHIQVPFLLQSLVMYPQSLLWIIFFCA